MINFIKKNADWIIIAFHSFVLFLAMFVSITDMDISGWLFVFFFVYALWVGYTHGKKTKTFKKFLNKAKLKIVQLKNKK